MSISNRFPYSNISRRVEKEHCVCIKCGKEFLAQRSSKRKFCSHSCSATYNNIHKLTGWNKNNRISLLTSPINKLKRKEQYLHKYGDVLGEQKWEEFRVKVSKNTPKDANAKWRYISKYGEIEGEKRHSLYQENVKKWNYIQKTTTLDERVGHERAEEIRANQRVGAKKNCGEHNGSFGIPRYPTLTFYPEIEHKVRSSWELEVAKFLQTNSIKYQYEGQRYKIQINDSTKSYTPDFIISPNLVIEVKGMMFEENYIKFINFLDQYKEKVVVLIWGKIQKEYIENLRKHTNLHILNYFDFSADLLQILGDHKQCLL